jgi:antirestriction protein ArdC
MTKAQRLDVHQAVTDQIVALIEAGTDDVRLPWLRSGMSSILPRNAATRQAYNGINILTLWAACETRGFDVSLWGTYRQWQSLDAQVRKGEKASLVVFYKQLEVEPEADDDNGLRHVAKASWVFNVSQVDGYTALPDLEPLPPVERNARAEAFLAATKATIRCGGDRAYYDRSTDHIQMPDEQLFRAEDTLTRSQDWYAVLSHELTHWAGSSTRLNRQFGKRFGDDAYAMEELVAELGAAFLCAELGLTPILRDDHASYVNHWLTVMKADKRAIFTAAAKASEAVRYLQAFSAADG